MVRMSVYVALAKEVVSGVHLRQFVVVAGLKYHATAALQTYDYIHLTESLCESTWTMTLLRCNSVNPI